MKQIGLSFFTDINWSLTGFLIFLLLFVAILALMTKFYTEDRAKEFSEIPFKGDNNAKG